MCMCVVSSQFSDLYGNCLRWVMNAILQKMLSHSGYLGKFIFKSIGIPPKTIVA